MYDLVANCLYLAIGALWVVLAVFKSRAWRRQRFPALLVMAVASAATAVSFLCSAPAVAAVINESSGVGFLGLLIVYVARLLFGAGAVVLVLLWAPPSRRRAGEQAWAVPYAAVRTQVRRKVGWVYGPVIAAMLVLFALFPPGLDSSLPLDTTYAAQPPVLAFLLVYQAAFAWGLWQLGRTCRRHATAAAAQRLLRRSLRCLAVGSALIGGYCLTKCVAIGAAAAGTHVLDWVGSVVSPLSGCVGCLVLAVGWAGAAAAGWRQRRADYRALRPLWTAAMQVDGRLALDGPRRPWAEWLTARDLEWRLTRRTREIRDGQLALRPWVPEDVVAAARRCAAEHPDMAPQEREAAVAAAAFVGGLRALRARQRPERHCEHTPGADVAPGDERRHLVLVARHLQGPFVTRVLAEAS
ncbi:MAB_1171c family putative transporter [Streptomyces sp. NPDC059788]|uniref:MAB_1171c family putative transporter n=1 Tax=Streptomyces sp. NPDC059788 TaxID=3346948 RepID=UPI00365784CB